MPAEPALRSEILKQNHDDPLAGHFGRNQTLELIRRKYYWPHISQEVKDYVAGCDTCQRSKAPRHKPYGMLVALPATTRPLGDVTMDFITGLPPSKDNGQVYDLILVIIDRFTKIARYLPVRKTIDAPELASTLIRTWVKDFGLPDSIVSDRGSVFTAKFWSSLCYHLKIKRKLSTAFHPQTDGQTERQNQTLEQYLRMYVNYQQDNWVELLPMAEFAYNNSHHSSLGASPFYALMGLDPAFDTYSGEAPINTPAATERVLALQALRKELESNLRKARTQQAQYYDAKRKPRTYKKGDLVWVNAKNIRTLRPSRKLDFKQLGPFRVLEAVEKLAYRLELPRNLCALHAVFPVVLLKPYTPGKQNLPNNTTAVEIDGEEEYQVAEILDHTIKNGKTLYLVRWEEYSTEQNTWEPVEDLTHARESIEEYHSNRPSSNTKGIV